MIAAVRTASIPQVHVAEAIEVVARSDAAGVDLFEFPREGRGTAAGPIAVLDGGYDGWWELELLSDDGRLGVGLPDSWRLPAAELLRRGPDGFDRCWRNAQELREEVV